MRVDEFKLGMRVKQRDDESSFVRSRRDHPQIKGRRVGVVISLPERIGDRHLAAKIQFEGSSRVETLVIHRLMPLPPHEQPVALGGKWQPEAAAS